MLNTKPQIGEAVDFRIITILRARTDNDIDRLAGYDSALRRHVKNRLWRLRAQVRNAVRDQVKSQIRSMAR